MIGVTEMGYIRNPYTNVPKEIATCIDELKGVISVSIKL